MDNKLLFLGLGIISTCLIGCTDSNAVRNATQEYVKANGQSLFAISLLGALGGDAQGTIEISQWNNIPIDTITKGEFYRYELRTRIKRANEYKSNTLHRDSVHIECNRRDMNSAYSDVAREVYRNMLRESTQTLKTHQKEYQHQVDQIIRLRELVAQPDQDEALFLVYQCTERISYNHPLSGERVQKEINCFSYADQVQQAVVYVDEGENDYIVPKFEKLHSPYKEVEVEEEVELL